MHTLRPLLARQRQRWRRLPRWVRLGLVATSVAGFLKAGVQVLIQVSPRITPPAASFLLHSQLRLRYRNIDQTIAQLQLTPTLRVLEIGGGTGTFTIPLAQAVAPTGALWSIELQLAMLRQQDRRVTQAGVTNAHLHQANALHLPFVDAGFDRVVMIAVLPMLPDKQQALREARRVLKPGGLLAVSEELIEPEYVPLALSRRWCRQAGFEHHVTYRTLWFYLLLFRNPRQMTYNATPDQTENRK
jgi:ubiquinone/menaquinone biosynthesis C-methylase UbiE